MAAGIALGSLALATCAARAEVLDDFEDADVTATNWTWTVEGGTGGYEVAGGQLTLTNTPVGDQGFGFVTGRSKRQFTVKENRTLEFRVDLLSTSHDGAMARLGFSQDPGVPDAAGYVFFLDRDSVVLVKRPNPLQVFYLRNGSPINTTNVKMVVSLTGLPSGVLIQLQVRDNAPGGTVWSAPPFIDTSAADPLARGTDDPPGSLLGKTGIFLLGLYDDSPAYLDPEVGIGRTEQAVVTFDNAEVLEYDSAWIAPPSNALLLNWPENTAEEQIVVGATSLASNTVWTPWPEPIFKRFGQFSMAVPTTSTQLFLKLVPGTQFIDDFDPLKQPFAARNPWEPFFFDAGDASRFTFTITNGAFQIETLTQPLNGQVAVFTPGGGAILRDFYASVDILDWASSQESALGIAGRVQGGPGGVSNAYLGSVRMNPTAGTGRLYFFNGAPPDVEASDEFSVDRNFDYRLEFSVVGSELTLRLFRLTNPPTLVRKGTLPVSRFAQGRVALWVNTRGSTGYMRTLDNFFVTGTKP